MAAEANLSLLRQSAIVILAQQAALRIVKRRIQAQGRVKLSTLSAATLTRIANDYLREHPELLCRTQEIRSNVGGLRRKDFRCANLMNEMEGHDDSRLRKGQH